MFQIACNSNLPFNEQYVLWGLRLWHLGHRTDSHVMAELHAGFLGGGAPNAAQSLARMMMILANSCHRQPEVNCVCVDTVSDDENLILNSIAQCQIGNSGVLHFWLDELAPPPIVTLLLPLLEKFADDLIDGSIFMSRERIYLGSGLMVCASPKQQSIKTLL